MNDFICLSVGFFYVVFCYEVGFMKTLKSMRKELEDEKLEDTKR